MRRPTLIKPTELPESERLSEHQGDAARPDDLCEALRQAILAGEYPFGSRLKIDEIARRFGVSHMPVRKALIQLEGQQLVTATPNRGASVRAIDVDFAGNTFDIVMPLEALLARRASERMKPPVLNRLAETEAEFEDAAARQDAAAIADTNVRFHQIIADTAGNPEAARIVSRSQELLRAFRRTYGFDSQRLPGIIADHRALLRAMAEGDADGAAALAAGHVAKARGDLLARIRSGVPDAARARDAR
jgi:DNA-binding GntR family transcriptional regulator